MLIETDSSFRDFNIILSSSGNSFSFVATHQAQKRIVIETNARILPARSRWEGSPTGFIKFQSAARLKAVT